MFSQRYPTGDMRMFIRRSTSISRTDFRRDIYFHVAEGESHEAYWFPHDTTNERPSGIHDLRRWALRMCKVETPVGPYMCSAPNICVYSFPRPKISDHHAVLFRDLLNPLIIVRTAPSTVRYMSVSGLGD